MQTRRPKIRVARTWPEKRKKPGRFLGRASSKYLFPRDFFDVAGAGFEPAAFGL